MTDVDPFERRLRAAEARIRQEGGLDAWVRWAGTEMDGAAKRGDWDRVRQVLSQIEAHPPDPAVSIHRAAANIDRQRAAEDETARQALSRWEDYERAVLLQLPPPELP